MISVSESQTDESRARIGLIGVALFIILVFALITVTLYALQNVYGFAVPYPRITITLMWAAAGLVGVWILGQAIYRTLSPLIGERGAKSTRKIVTVVLLFAVFFATLDRMGIDLSVYLVSLGVTAIVVGFAAQTTIGNLLAGALVLISKPFRRGDYIRVNISGGPIEGTIDEISFLRSRVLTNDGVSISVPNTVMLNTPISNFTIFERRPIILNAVLDRNVSVDTFRTKIEAVLGTNESRAGDTRFYVKGFDDECTTVELWVHVATGSFLKERSQIVSTIQEAFRKEQIGLKKIELQS